MDAEGRVLHLSIDEVFREFFNRRLDIEESDAIKTVLRASIESKAGSSQAKQEWEESFAAYMTDESGIQQQLSSIRDRAEAEGVFGVPSFVVGGDLYFGNDRFHWVRRRVEELLAS